MAEQDVKALGVKEVVEQLNIYADIAGTEHEEFIIREAIATIDRLSAQLATARKGLEWFADEDAECPHEPKHHFVDDELLDCSIRVAADTLAAIEEKVEEPWEDAAMKRQSDAALKTVVESANNALVAFDAFITARHDGVDFVYDQIGGVMEELRGVLHGAIDEKGTV